MARFVTDWSPFPACPTCDAGRGEQCVNRRSGGLSVYPHDARRGLDRHPIGATVATGARVRAGAVRVGIEFPAAPADRTRAVKALLSELGYGPAVKVKSAAGTETVVTIGDYEPKELRAALRKLKWQGMQIDSTETTLVITQQ